MPQCSSLRRPLWFFKMCYRNEIDDDDDDFHSATCPAFLRISWASWWRWCVSCPGWWLISRRFWAAATGTSCSAPCWPGWRSNPPSNWLISENCHFSKYSIWIGLPHRWPVRTWPVCGTPGCSCLRARTPHWLWISIGSSRRLRLKSLRSCRQNWLLSGATSSWRESTTWCCLCRSASLVGRQDAASLHLEQLLRNFLMPPPPPLDDVAWGFSLMIMVMFSLGY